MRKPVCVWRTHACTHAHTRVQQTDGTAAAPAPVAMASSAWHHGNGGAHVTAGEGERTALLPPPLLL